MATIRFARLAHGHGLELPGYQTDGSAGMDLRAAVLEPLVLEPGERQAVPTGMRIAISGGFEGQVRARSGLAFRKGLAVINAPGTIDSDYRGELKVLLINHGTDRILIERGERIAQLVIAPVVQATVVEVEDLDATQRGGGGFGSTGTR
ncbi:MAG TPA: dUTP diphosphatase [Myxococcota bacterium]|nr:dUTP diphosphatase [Myxococcota bacterium]